MLEKSNQLNKKRERNENKVREKERERDTLLTTTYRCTKI